MGYHFGPKDDADDIQKHQELMTKTVKIYKPGDPEFEELAKQYKPPKKKKKIDPMAAYKGLGE